MLRGSEKRILILELAASGKSTLSKKLGQKLGLLEVPQDMMFFEEDDTAVDHQKAMQNVEEKLKGGSWIVEGNYTQILERCVDEADRIIFLDFGRLFSLYKVIKRKLLEKMPSKEMAIGGKHRLPLHFVRFILFVYPKVQRTQKEILELKVKDKTTFVKNWKQFMKLQNKVFVK